MPSKDIRCSDDTFVKDQDSYYQVLAGGPTRDYLGVGEWTQSNPNGTTTTSHAHAFIKFAKDWNIPVGAVITDATLFVHNRENLGNHRETFISARAVAGNWNPNTLSFANAPFNFYTDWTPDNVSSRPGSWTRFPCKWYAERAAFDATFRARGIRLSDTSNSGHNRTNFHSEQAGGGGSAPYIRVSYNLPPPRNTSAHPNEAKSKIIVEGNGATGGSAQVFSSRSKDGSYAFLGTDPNPVGNHYVVDDNDKANAPSRPTISGYNTTGNDVTINWNGSSQDSLTKWYKARNVFGGENSSYSPPDSGTLTPNVRYVVQRRRMGTNSQGDNYPWEGVPITATTQTVDSNVTVGVNYTYRVYAINSQGTSSPNPATIDVSLVPPDPPTLTSVTTENDAKYVISGGNAEAGTRIRVYYTGSGDPFEDNRYEEFPAPQGGGAWSLDFKPTTKAPRVPEFIGNNPAERSINLHWGYAPGREPNEPVSLRFGVKSIKSGLLSEMSNNVIQKTLTPSVEKFRLETRPSLGNSDFNSPKGWNGATPGPDDEGFRKTNGWTDTDVIPDKEYRYRLTAKNSMNQVSESVIVDERTRKPAAPILANPLLRTNTGSKRREIYLYGRDLDGAVPAQGNKVTIQQRSSTGVWVNLPQPNYTSKVEADTTTSEFNLTVPPTIAGPSRPAWITFKADYTGVNLKWMRPDNPETPMSFRAFRTIDTVPGIYTNEKTITIKPTVNRFLIKRKKINDAGEEQEPYKTIKTGDITSYLDTNVDFSSTYRYQIIPVNDEGEQGTPSIEKDVPTINAPPPDRDEDPYPPPQILTVQPTGTVELSSDPSIPLRVVWGYYDESNFTQYSYKLKLTWDSGGIQSRWWDGDAWAMSETQAITQDNYADLDTSVFTGTNEYTFSLSVISNSGETSTTREWVVDFAVYYSAIFDLHRSVKATYQESFDLYRRVDAYDTGAQFVLAVAWEVEPNLPFVVDDDTWEGGGNAFPWTVYDRDGRPEPYASIDFVQDGVEKYSFDCDDRGRIVLYIPDDIEPGIYTVRERGPSMAPRTTKNFVVYEPWMIYHHGHRHAADGPDPITGITRDQIDENANIPAEMVEGAASLGELVNSYGSDIRGKLEEHVSAGHGNYVVEGLSALWDATKSALVVSAGRCWEAGHLRKIPYSELTITTDGKYKVYVTGGTLMFSIRNDHPPDSCPLYTISKTGTDVTITNNRLFLPSPGISGEITPVRWGASTTADLLHKDEPLESLLQGRIDKLDKRIADEDSLHNKFFASNKNTEVIVKRDQEDRLRAREAMLVLGKTTSLKSIYTLLEGRPSANLSNVSIFSVGDELSSASTILTRNKLATLPNKWVMGTRYIMRTLRVSGAPSRYLEFHLLYEETGARFDVKGSLGIEGSYLPKIMDRTVTVSDSVRISTEISSTVDPRSHLPDLVTRVTEEETYNLKIATWRGLFPWRGDEAVVELGCIGGSASGDGVRLRGWAVVMA